MRCLIGVCLLATLASADRFEEHKPDTRVKGKLLAWRSITALYDLSKRVLAQDGTGKSARARAEKAVATIERLAE